MFSSQEDWPGILRRRHDLYGEHTQLVIGAYIDMGANRVWR